jgi:hypothetical protein
LTNVKTADGVFSELPFDYLLILCNMEDEDVKTMLKKNHRLSLGYQKSLLLLPRLAKQKGIAFFTMQLSNQKTFGTGKKTTKRFTCRVREHDWIAATTGSKIFNGEDIR